MDDEDDDMQGWHHQRELEEQYLHENKSHE
jgi:hypothetical protein